MDEEEALAVRAVESIAGMVYAGEIGIRGARKHIETLTDTSTYAGAVAQYEIGRFIPGAMRS